MGSQTHAPPTEVGAVSGNGAAEAEVETEKSRRALLKGLGVAAAGAVVGGVLSPEESHADHGQLNGTSNDANPAIHGTNTSLGPGVQGDSADGIGLFGDSESGIGVLGGSDSGPGVRGQANSGTGVEGFSVAGTGVEGFSDAGVGVEGRSDGTSFGSIGVGGRADSAIGVAGFTESGIAVHARATGAGTALNVIGPARFSTMRAGTIPNQQSSVAVLDSAVTADSHITMTLTGNPGSAGSGLPAVIVWIQRQPGTGFTAHLSRKVTRATPFTYLIVEPG